MAGPTWKPCLRIWIQPWIGKDLTPDLDGDRILPGFRGLTKEPDLPAKIYEMASAATGKAKSNQVVWLLKNA